MAASGAEGTNVENNLTELSCEEFADQLAARTSVPGGGAAAALVGALGAALCSMSAAFTAGNPRCADVRGDALDVVEEAADVRFRLLELVEEDARGFLPVARAYARRADDPGRPAAIQDAMAGASMAPLSMMGECCRAVELLERMGEACSRAMLSDVASGALLVRAALEVASVNVLVNTASLADRAHAEVIDGICDELMADFAPRAERLAARMRERIASGGRR